MEKISVFCPKKYLYSKEYHESCVRDFLVLFSVFVRQKVTVTEDITFADSVSKKIQKMTMASPFFDMTSTSNFLTLYLFLLSSLVAGPSLMSISPLVLELWQFYFIRDWPEILKSEIPPSEFCPTSGDWCELWIPILARMFLIERYWMLQNSRVAAFTVFELLRENQLGGRDYPSPTQIRVN